MKDRKVILRRCETYAVPTLCRIVEEGIEDLGEKPAGRILVKPNVVCATPVIRTAYTHPAVVEAVVLAVRARARPGSTISIAESGGMAIPTRLFFRDAGYTRMAKRIRVPLRDFNEERLVRVSLSRAKWHRTLLAARSLYEADYKIWVPKLKFHNACRLTHAIKLNMGILTHRERMLYHDDRLDEKIVDLLEAGYPNLVISDAVEIGYGSEFAPYPYPLGAVLLANDPLAADVVAARILGFSPQEAAHLVEASGRGYGSLDLQDIQISGDVPLEELSSLAAKIDSPYGVSWEPEKLETRARFYVGVNPETGRPCRTGCLNALVGALATSELYHPGLVRSLPPMGIVVGRYRGDVLHPGEKVALIGSCSAVEGRLEAGKVVRQRGCPAKGMDQAVWLFPRLGIPTPAWSPANVAKMSAYSVLKGLRILFKSFSGPVGRAGGWHERENP